MFYNISFVAGGLFWTEKIECLDMKLNNFADCFPFLHNAFYCWFGVLQIGKYPFLDRVVLVIEVDPVFESLGHDLLRHLEQDDLVRGLDPGHEELGLLHVGGEPVNQEPGGRGHPCHGHG